MSATDADWDDDGVSRPSEFADGFQSHSVYDGYGTGNTFSGNRVEGAIPGFGVGLYPALDNVVTCDNEAPDAANGLVGDNSTPIPCTPYDLTGPLSCCFDSRGCCGGQPLGSWSTISSPIDPRTSSDHRRRSPYGVSRACGPGRERSAVGVVRIVDVDVQKRWKQASHVGGGDHHDRVTDHHLDRSPGRARAASERQELRPAVDIGSPRSAVSPSGTAGEEMPPRDSDNSWTVARADRSRACM